jgi:hypothetical protein
MYVCSFLPRHIPHTHTHTHTHIHTYTHTGHEHRAQPVAGRLKVYNAHMQAVHPPHIKASVRVHTAIRNENHDHPTL